ncbi:MAG: alpha/beta fold hydrolase [Candidatus Baltobacteraceae bacterium]|jgi:alpha-beta hydrolase superfamily lysophospholipase
MELTEAPSFVSHRSILLSHGARTPKAFLLLHGLTASPQQFASFGRLLFERGANVFIPRLPRHGLADRLTTSLAGLTAEELDAFAHESVDAAHALGERLTVVGFSLGGLLAAWIAQHVEVDRAVPIAPFLGSVWVPRPVAPSLARLALRMPNRFVWWHPVLRERLQPEHGYPRYPTHALAQSYYLVQRLLSVAAQQAPLAHEIEIVVNASETAVDNRSARRLARLWNEHRPTPVGFRSLGGLPPSHDIIEPLATPRLAPRVYPKLLESVDP